jgi:predicted transcriptional regulator of viral defense system
MKLDALIHLLSGLPLFDFATVVQLSGDRPSTVRVQLYRWMKRGAVVQLRRGLYTLADEYRRAPLSPLLIANELYKPSYLSGIWALSYYGLIPERVVVYTNVATRVARTFVNHFGEFRYSTVRRTYFWGLVSREIDRCNTWIAEPEKALLDFWHLSPGEWTDDRVFEMRFQNHEVVDPEKLLCYAERWQSPRLTRATYKWLESAKHETQESVEV